MAVGGLFGAAGSLGAAGISAREAEKQRKWTRKMRRTAYQDTMSDMMTAGLNPILAYKTGPTPIGSAAMGVTPDFGQAMASGVNAAVKVAKMRPEIKETKTRTAKFRREALLADLRARLEAQRVDAKKGLSEASLLDAQRDETSARAQLLRAEIPRAEAIKRYDESKQGQFLNWTTESIRRATQALPIPGFRAGGRR